jgi:hypothetical protein
VAEAAPVKGRVECKHGVYQDRFIKELALRGITTIGAANALVERGFVEELKARFEREALVLKVSRTFMVQGERAAHVDFSPPVLDLGVRSALHDRLDALPHRGSR